MLQCTYMRHQFWGGPRVVDIHDFCHRVFREVRSNFQKVGPDMNIARKIAIATVAAGLSFGLLGISAPAHADSRWSYSIRK